MKPILSSIYIEKVKIFNATDKIRVNFINALIIAIISLQWHSSGPINSIGRSAHTSYRFA